jgi:hypothetical protein
MPPDDLKALVLSHLSRFEVALSSPGRHLEAERYGAAVYQRRPLVLLEVQARKKLLETMAGGDMAAELDRKKDAIRKAILATGGMIGDGADIVEVLEAGESFLRVLREVCSG